MSKSKIYHNVILPWKSATATGTNTGTKADTNAISTKSEWLDVDGWTEKKVFWEIDDAGTAPSYNLKLRFSSKSAYELNNQATVTTDDYKEVTLLTTASTGKVYAQVDGADIDDLSRPMRSCQIVVIGNVDAPTGTATKVTDTLNIGRAGIEGWS
jgi:hypothetical protein